MEIILHRNQATVLESSSRFKVLAAGRRFGKTVLACIALFLSAIKVKNGTFWYVSPTYRQSKQIAWKILLRMIPAEYLIKKPNETELSFTFKNGTEICLKGADNMDSLRGSGLEGLVIDEFASIRYSKSVWEEVLRPSLADKQGWCLFIGTPKGKDAFYDLWNKGQRKEEGYESWRFKTEDNPYIARSEIKEAREQLSDRFFRQEFEASFEDFTGLVWPEFSKSHIIDPFEIEEPTEKIGSIDPAMTGTTASLWAKQDREGMLYIVGEFYQQNVRVSDVAGALRGKAETWYCDPSGKRKHSTKDGQLFSFFDEFSDNGMFLLPAQNDVNAGINRTAEYFRQNKVKIFRTCQNLLRELETYRWSEERETISGVIEPKPFKANDHACDCLRYLVMSRPDTPVKQRKLSYEEVSVIIADPFRDEPKPKEEFVGGIEE